jgi:hypothetical protein
MGILLMFSVEIWQWTTIIHSPSEISLQMKHGMDRELQNPILAVGPPSTNTCLLRTPL